MNPKARSVQASRRPAKKPVAPKSRPHSTNETEFNVSELIRRMEAMADHVEGKKDLPGVRVTEVAVPAPVPARGKAEVRALRTKLNLSQAAFALLLNVPVKTAISWETGVRRPSGAALKLLHIADHSPQVLSS